VGYPIDQVHHGMPGFMNSHFQKGLWEIRRKTRSAGGNAVVNPPGFFNSILESALEVVLGLFLPPVVWIILSKISSGLCNL
jgi:hypothetical protein